MRIRWQSLASIILYILILAGALGFNLLKLIDFKLVLLVILGTVVLTLPFYEKDIKRRELWYIFGRKAMEAGFIQTFLLLFMRLQNSSGSNGLLSDIALCFRPLLYGFCMQLCFSERREEEKPQSNEALDLTEMLKTYGLTKRELEIAGLIAEGKSNAEIAEKLYISETTVKKHVSNIFEKMGISRREELLLLAHKI